MSNIELQQISKQVSLLNRLIELLRMQEEPKLEDLKEFTCRAKRGFDGYAKWPLVDGSYITAIDNHPSTQKAGSDELVKVARELLSDDSGNQKLLKKYLIDICESLEIDIDTNGSIFTRRACEWLLGNILNKYGISLSE